MIDPDRDLEESESGGALGHAGRRARELSDERAVLEEITAQLATDERAVEEDIVLLESECRELAERLERSKLRERELESDIAALEDASAAKQHELALARHQLERDTRAAASLERQLASRRDHLTRAKEQFANFADTLNRLQLKLRRAAAARDDAHGPERRD